MLEACTKLPKLLSMEKYTVSCPWVAAKQLWVSWAEISWHHFHYYCFVSAEVVLEGCCANKRIVQALEDLESWIALSKFTRANLKFSNMASMGEFFYQVCGRVILLPIFFFMSSDNHEKIAIAYNDIGYMYEYTHSGHSINPFLYTNKWNDLYRLVYSPIIVKHLSALYYYYQ